MILTLSESNNRGLFTSLVIEGDLVICDVGFCFLIERDGDFGLKEMGNEGFLVMRLE